MSEHTPTPWAVDPIEKDVIVHRGTEVARVLPRRDETKANAAFIVKAVNAHDALVTELKLIADWRKVSLAGEYEHSLRDIIRSMLDCADRALASIKETAT